MEPESGKALTGDALAAGSELLAGSRCTRGERAGMVGQSGWSDWCLGLLWSRRVETSATLPLLDEAETDSSREHPYNVVRMVVRWFAGFIGAPANPLYINLQSVTHGEAGAMGRGRNRRTHDSSTSHLVQAHSNP